MALIYRLGASTCRVSKLAPSKYMEVQMRYRLTRVRANVWYQSIGLEFRLLNELTRRAKDIRNQFTMISAEFRSRGNVELRDDQHMKRSNWIDIRECDDMVRLERECGIGVSGDDVTEDAVLHDDPL